MFEKKYRKNKTGGNLYKSSHDITRALIRGNLEEAKILIDRQLTQRIEDSGFTERGAKQGGKAIESHLFDEE